jgi:hypothetical protein
MTDGRAAQLHAQQTRQVTALSHWATRRSAFYRRCHAGLSDRPLAELPVLTKAALMEHFDETSTGRMSGWTTSSAT